MATEQLAPIPLPQAPSSDQDLRGLSRWARVMQRSADLGFARIVRALNAGFELSGSWSPGISGDDVSGSATYAHRRGRWTLIGQEVSAWGDVEVSLFSILPEGNLRIHGLPFAHSTETPESVGVVVPRSGIFLSTDYTQLTAVVHTNSQTVRFLEWGSGQEAQLVQGSSLDPDFPVRLEVFLRYRKQADVVVDPA